MVPKHVERWVREVEEWQRRLAPKLPDIDAMDLHQILLRILQPEEVPRRFLLRKLPDGGYTL